MGALGTSPRATCAVSGRFTSSYVYIRLVLVTLLVEEIQHTIFYIAVFPTVSKMYSKGRLLGYLDHLLTNICFTSQQQISLNISITFCCTHTRLLLHHHPSIIHQSLSSNLSFSPYFLLAIYGNFHIQIVMFHLTLKYETIYLYKCYDLCSLGK